MKMFLLLLLYKLCTIVRHMYNMHGHRNQMYRMFRKKLKIAFLSLL